MHASTTPSPDPRYHRQAILPMVGAAGQARLSAGRVLLVGCGALGTAIADLLARAGVGRLRIVDRDIVEPSNLQRQCLFDESDAAESRPKALAAAQRLRAVNSAVAIEAVCAHVDGDTLEPLLRFDEGARPLIVDATDNARTRYLLNDAGVKHRLAWVYGGCIGVEGRAWLIRPGAACLRCVFPSPPAAGELPTCDTAGVLGSAASMVAALQATMAIRHLLGDDDELAGRLFTLDAWRGRMSAIDVAQRDPRCPCCTLGRLEFLDSPPGDALSLCGRDAVQIRPTPPRAIDLHGLQRRLSPATSARMVGDAMLRVDPADAGGLRLSIFADGRAIVQGTSDLARAKSFYDRYIGS